MRPVVEEGRRSWVETDPAKRAVLELVVESLPTEGDPCPTCEGGRWLRVGPMLPADSGTHLGARMPSLARRVIPCPDCNAPKPEDLLADSGIPEMYAGMTFDTFPALDGKTEALAAMRAWVESPHNLVLFGENGRGKSGLAAAAVRWLCEHGTAARFVQVLMLISRVKRGFADDSAERLLDGFRNAHVLVLDDIARARATPWVAEQIPALLEERRVMNRPTVLTTDVGSDALQESYGLPFVSRLREYERVYVGGVDLRGGKSNDASRPSG